MVNCFVHRRRLPWNVVFRFSRLKENAASRGVELIDLKFPYLAFTPAIAPRCFEHPAQPWSQLRRLLFRCSLGELDIRLVRQKPLPDVSLFQHSKIGGTHDFGWRLLRTIVESRFEQREFPVDRRILRRFLAASGLRLSVVDVPFDQIGGDLRGTKMPKERLKVGLPTRLIILDGTVLSLPRNKRLRLPSGGANQFPGGATCVR